jgi:hypothetical protein
LIFAARIVPPTDDPITLVSSWKQLCQLADARLVPARLSSIISFCDADSASIDRAVQKSRMSKAFPRASKRRIAASDRRAVAHRSLDIRIEFSARAGVSELQAQILEEHVISTGLQLR